MKKIVLISVLCLLAVLFTACRYKIVDTYKEREESELTEEENKVSEEAYDSYEDLEKETEEEVLAKLRKEQEENGKKDVNSEIADIVKDVLNDVKNEQKEKKEQTEQTEKKQTMYEMLKLAKEKENEDHPALNDYSSLFKAEARVGSKANPIKVGEVGIGTTMVSYSGDKYGTYGHNTFLKVVSKMSDEEVESLVEEAYANNPNKERNEDFVWTGLNCEVDFNGNVDLAKYISLDMDKRLSELPVITIDSSKFNQLTGVVFKATVDDNMYDNRIQIVFSQFKEKDDDALLKVTFYKGDTQYPDEFLYSYFKTN